MDLAGEEAGAEAVVVALAGVAAGDGDGKKAKAETKAVFEIMHTPTRATPKIESYIANGSRESDVVVSSNGALHVVLTRMN